MHHKLIIVGIIVIGATALLLSTAEVYCDSAFIDRNTGSRKGYRNWSLGWRSGSWYRESAIETFMRSEYPAEFQQDWVSYVGTGRNIFGHAINAGHGRPGPILLLKPEILEGYCQTASRAEKRSLYNVLSSGDDTKIRDLIDKISKANMVSEITNQTHGCNDFMERRNSRVISE